MNESMPAEDLGVTCLGCGVPMRVMAKGDYEFEATCPSCGGRIGLSFDEPAASKLVEMRNSELCRRFNENRAVERGKVVRLNEKD